MPLKSLFIWKGLFDDKYPSILRLCVTRKRPRFGEEFEFGKNGILANPKPKAKVGRGKGRISWSDFLGSDGVTDI